MRISKNLKFYIYSVTICVLEKPENNCLGHVIIVHETLFRMTHFVTNIVVAKNDLSFSLSYLVLCNNAVLFLLINNTF